LNAERGKASVVSVGRLYCDLIFIDLPRLPTLGTEVFAGGFAMCAGGGACITAAHLQSLGRPASLAATMPTEPFGSIVREHLVSARIDLSLCQHSKEEIEPQLTVALSNLRDRAFITHRAGPAAPALTADDLRRVGAVHLHVGELATLVELPWLLPLARSVEVTVSLDCGWDDSLTANHAAPLISAVDIFLPNETEVERLSQIGVPRPFAPLTVIKRGAEGATAESSIQQISVPAEKVDPVDTVGAGDAFNAGFLDAWLGGANIAECLRAGNRSGARAVGLRGGF